MRMLTSAPQSKYSTVCRDYLYRFIEPQLFRRQGWGLIFLHCNSINVKTLCACCMQKVPVFHEINAHLFCQFNLLNSLVRLTKKGVENSLSLHCQREFRFTTYSSVWRFTICLLTSAHVVCSQFFTLCYSSSAEYRMLITECYSWNLIARNKRLPIPRQLSCSVSSVGQVSHEGDSLPWRWELQQK